MTITTFELEGFTVQRQLDVVCGITVRSRSIFGTLGASLQTLVGGNIIYSELCEKTRSEASGQPDNPQSVRLLNGMFQGLTS